MKGMSAMLRRLLGLGAGAVAALTAACDGAPMTQQVYVNDHAVGNYLQYSSSPGPLLVVVHGNPFVTTKPFLDGIVAKELEASITRVGNAHLTTDPELAAKPEYRVIMVLGAHKAVDGDALCAGETPRLEPEADPLRMVTVFCRKTEMISLVRGSIGPQSSPEDKRFRDWVRQIGRDLFVPGS